MNTNLAILGASVLATGYGIYSINKANDSSAWESSVNSPACKVADPASCGSLQAYNEKCNQLAMSGFVSVVVGSGLFFLWLYCAKMLKNKYSQVAVLVLFVAVIVTGLAMKQMSKPRPEKKNISIRGIVVSGDNPGCPSPSIYPPIGSTGTSADLAELATLLNQYVFSRDQAEKVFKYSLKHRSDLLNILRANPDPLVVTTDTGEVVSVSKGTNTEMCFYPCHSALQPLPADGKWPVCAY